jgi:hypothetical protein
MRSTPVENLRVEIRIIADRRSIVLYLYDRMAMSAKDQITNNLGGPKLA